jgi:FtsP/CotA-like multicopper oxidase with cupredoxin domain
MKRREFLQLSGSAFIGSALLKYSSGNATSNASSIKLDASVGSVNFDGQMKDPVQVMFYNQSIPGPVLRISQGRQSIIEFHNKLDQATSMHWHGLRIDNTMDGVPGMTQELIQPQS